MGRVAEDVSRFREAVTPQHRTGTDADNWFAALLPERWEREAVEVA